MDSYSRWGSMTIVPALLLFYFACRPIEEGRQGRPERPLLSRNALAILAAAYLALPVMLSNWNYLNCRLVPFLWAGLALRLPRTLPRPVVVLLAACALSFSAVLGIDYVRLDRDRAEFTAGIEAVPARATNGRSASMASTSSNAFAKSRAISVRAFCAFK